MNKKKCSKCGEEKDLSAFNKNASKKDGSSCYCTVCRRIMAKAYYHNVCKEKSKAYGKSYYEANKDTINAKTKVYYEANKDALKVAKKTYYEANKDILKVKRKEYCKKRKLQIRRLAKKNILLWRKNNVEKIKKYKQKQRYDLSDTYILEVLKLKKSECPQMLIEAKRAQLKLLRLANQD